MLTSLVLAMAMTSQVPTTPRTQAQAMHAELVAKNRARRSAKVSAGVALERARKIAQYQAQREAQAAYERALPYLMEQQRQELQAMDAAQRNAALHRMAGAAEVQAQASQTAAWWLWTRGR